MNDDLLPARDGSRPAAWEHPMSLADPLISDDVLATISGRHTKISDSDLVNDRIERWDTCSECSDEDWPCKTRLMLDEIVRLRAHNAHLTGLFYGTTEFFGHLCEKHAAIPLEQRDLSRTVVPACQGCQEDDLRAVVDGNVEATTMAERLREAGARNITLMIENDRLKHGDADQ